MSEILEEVKIYIENEDEKGDFVRCSDCGCLQLIQIGGTACGECESEDLQWADDNRQETTIEELENLGYIID